MKYLEDYIEEKRTKLFKETNVFFAFGKKQFNANKKAGITYVSMRGGLFCDKRYVEKLIYGLDDILTEGLAKDIIENGIEQIILRELDNHEARNSMNLDSSFEFLQHYGITKKLIWKLYNNKNANL